MSATTRETAPSRPDGQPGEAETTGDGEAQVSGEAQAARGQSRAVQREVARYVSQMSGELAAMARKSDFDLLAYFLEMARVEARALVRKFEQGGSRPR